MIREVAHIGVTVSDMDESIAFYRDILGLKFEGEVTMRGEATDVLFQGKDVVARVAYLNGGDDIKCPPVELISFEKGWRRDKCDLTKTSISEICFIVDDIDAEYERLKALGVEFLSSPQHFDFRDAGMSESKAVYFKDRDGIILELMQYIK